MLVKKNFCVRFLSQDRVARFFPMKNKAKKKKVN